MESVRFEGEDRGLETSSERHPERGSERRSERHLERLILRCATLGWVAQLALALTLPQVADEAYYARWGERLSLGYLDHPPAVAWWSALGGRALNLTLLPIAWLLFESAARRLGASLKPMTLLAAAWLTPLGLSSGVLVTPDAPLLLGWSVAVWGYSTRNPLVSALGVAWGAWSKAMIWPAALGLGWLWLSDPRARSRRERINQSLVWVIALGLCYAPHIVWSSQHEWLPWSFQSGRAWRRPFILEWIGGQLLVGGGLWAVTLGGLIFNGVRHGLKRGESRGKSSGDRVKLSREERARQWFWLSAPSAIVWTMVSLGTRAEANWSALAWPMGLVWALDVITSDELKRHLRWGALCVAPCLALPIIHLMIPIGLGPPRSGDELAGCIIKTTSTLSDPSQDLSQDLSQAQLSHPPQDISNQPQRPQQLIEWFAGRYQEAALLGLSLDGQSRDIAGHLSGHLSGVKLSYARARGRRLSQYDELQRHNVRDETALKRSQIPCGAIYLGPPEWVGDRCQGTPELIQASRDRCHLKISRCVCPPLPQ